MITKHTPGPYHSTGRLAQGGPGEHDSHIAIVAGPNIRIADVYARLDTHPEICPAEAEANATLIARAPDMLHWLEQTAHYLTSRQIMGHELTNGELWLLQHIQQTIEEARP